MWFRRDLRLDDLPALAAAGAAGGDGVVPLFVVDPRVLRPRPQPPPVPGPLPARA